MKYSVYCPACESRYSISGLHRPTSACTKCGHDGVQSRLVEDEATLRKRRDLRMVKGEIPWPGGELLPVKFSQDPKKALEMPRLGLLVKGKGPVVIFSNLYDVIQDPSLVSTANSKTYLSFEALLEDGWKVD